MPSYMLKQPDGLIAIFSSVVDDFTYMNMTEAEAMEVGTSEWGERISREKLDRALKDEVLWPGDTDFVSDGLGRWRETLESIALQHGLKHLRMRFEEAGLENVEIHQEAVDIAESVESDMDPESEAYKNRM